MNERDCRTTPYQAHPQQWGRGDAADDARCLYGRAPFPSPLKS